MPKKAYVGAKNTLKNMRRIILLENDRWYLEMSQGCDRPAEQIEAADLDNQRDITLTRIEMNHDQIDRIDGALLRIEAGEYGVCSDCRKPIEEKRLAAQPFSHRCRECEEAAEDRKGKKYPSGVGRFT